MKLITKRKCPNGETYIFKNGVAKVPGMRHSRGPYMITLKEFHELVKEVANENHHSNPIRIRPIR